jgi:enoyl-CoA hydratase/carnithine racemase
MTFVGIISDLTNFGAAGLMGAMWLWERKLSRRRERQLCETHERITRDEERLKLLIEVVDHNTAAVTRFAETQRQVAEALKDLTRELNHAH